MEILLNGEPRTVPAPLSVSGLLRTLGLDARKIAVERNLEIVPRSAYEATGLAQGDRLEIVHFIGGGNVLEPKTGQDDDPFVVAGRRFRSRLIIGTGKYRDYAENAAAAEAAGVEIVTVAVRRVNVSDPGKPMLVDYLDPKRFTYLPNTAGCFTAEVLGDQKTLYPNMPETLRAAELLIKEGFEVMVYCNDDPIQAKRLEELGCVAIMPLAAPIGSGLGIQNPVNIRLIVEQAKVPVIVDAGVGTASDATIAMELGCDGVLMNTAIAEAKNPVLMARAMKLAVESGRLAYRAGRMAKKRYADPSSPLAGLI
jgi:thiazole synthase